MVKKAKPQIKQTNEQQHKSSFYVLSISYFLSKCLDTKKGWVTAPIFQPEGHFFAIINAQTLDFPSKRITMGTNEL